MTTEIRRTVAGPDPEVRVHPYLAASPIRDLRLEDRHTLLRRERELAEHLREALERHASDDVMDRMAHGDFNTIGNVAVMLVTKGWRK